MSRPRPSVAIAAASVAVLLVAAPNAVAGANTAALQVALRATHHYGGPIDGIAGPGTRQAVRRFQRRRGLPADGVAGPRTRRALGRRGRPALGSRVMRSGHRGWDVAALQFMLGRRGFATGSIDGGFGPGTRAALRRFQRARSLSVDGRAGPATQGALRRGASRPRFRPGSGSVAGPVQFLRPVSAPIGDRFGPREGFMHTGIDFLSPAGAPVGAAGRGVVAFAGWNTGGYGYLIVVTHRLGFESWYAHLSSITAVKGQAVVGGTRIGAVGSTGRSTGPHLHFEVRHNGRPIDPAPRLLLVTAAGRPPLARPAGGEEECPNGARRHPGRRWNATAAQAATAPLAPCRPGEGDDVVAAAGRRP